MLLHGKIYLSIVENDAVAAQQYLQIITTIIQPQTQRTSCCIVYEHWFIRWLRWLHIIIIHLPLIREHDYYSPAPLPYSTRGTNCCMAVTISSEPIHYAAPCIAHVMKPVVWWGVRYMMVSAMKIATILATLLSSLGRRPGSIMRNPNKVLFTFSTRRYGRPPYTCSSCLLAFYYFLSGFLCSTVRRMPRLA